MFGNQITEFSQFTVGSVGYTIAIDLTLLNVEVLTGIQVDVNGTTDDVVTGNLTIEVVQNYINDSDAPDIAWAFSSDILILFLKTSFAAYVTTTKFVMYGKRMAVPITSLTQNIDIKDRDLPLFLRYTLSEAKKLQGKTSDPNDKLEITQLENIIGA